MKIDVFSAISINGILTRKKGESSLDLIKKLDVPKELLDIQYKTRRFYDAVMIGNSTAIIDNPKLNSHKTKNKKIIRITYDPYEKLLKDSFFLDGTQKTYVGLCEYTNLGYKKYLEKKCIDTIVAGTNRINFPNFFSKLEKKGISSILIEGGGKLNYELLKENLISEIKLIVLPIVLNNNSPNIFSSNKVIFQKLKLFKSIIINNYQYVTYRVDNK
jgi:5-amino-6-(5-phosphoribosylamino)uracil reductase